MVRTDLMPKQRKEFHGARHTAAFAASLFFHAALFGLLLYVTLGYRTKGMPPPSASPSTDLSFTLSTLVITPPPLPKPAKPVVAAMPVETAPKAPPSMPAPVENGAPVLTVGASKTVAVTQTKTSPPGPVSAFATPEAKTLSAKLKQAASAPFASSYAPGENRLPHPPYPLDAQNLGETGTVVMSVTFSPAGNVTQAEVSRSSGVRLLDTTTRSFILTHWHSTTLAGETVLQPVRYAGE